MAREKKPVYRVQGVWKPAFYYSTFHVRIFIFIKPIAFFQMT